MAGASRGPIELEIADLHRSLYADLVGASADAVGWAVAEELVQDLFEHTLSRWRRTGELPPNPAGYLRLGLTNAIRDRHRRRTVRVRALRRSPTPATDPDGGSYGQVYAALAELPRRQSQCISMRYLLELTVAEIADILDLSDSTVRSHLQAASTTLRSTLKEPR